MKFKNYYYLDKAIEPFSYIDLGSDTKISGSSSGISMNKNVKFDKGFKVGSDFSKNPTGDSFRIDYQGNYFGTYLDALVFEKTDVNDNSPDGGIAFVNTGKNNNKTNAFVIRGNGNVGVNTSNPSEKLHVNGNIRSNGTLCIGNTCINENDLKNIKNSGGNNYIKHGDSITIRSQRTGKRLQDSATNARFQNHNRASWEKLHIEKCGYGGIGHTPNNC